MRTVLIRGVLVMALGVGCLNYTTAGGADHHREWAAEKGLPEPSPTIFYLGVACTAMGAGSVGFALGRRGEVSEGVDDLVVVEGRARATRYMSTAYKLSITTR